MCYQELAVSQESDRISEKTNLFTGKKYQVKVNIIPFQLIHLTDLTFIKQQSGNMQHCVI